MTEEHSDLECEAGNSYYVRRMVNEVSVLCCDQEALTSHWLEPLVPGSRIMH